MDETNQGAVMGGQHATRGRRLQDIKRRLQQAFGGRLRGVVLYGSEAREEAGAESDVDILVLLQGPIDYGRDLRRSIDATYPVVLEWERPISPDPVDVEQYSAAEWPLYRRAAIEGMPL